MKNKEKKVNAPEEVKTEENGIELTDEQLTQVTGGKMEKEAVLPIKT